MVLNSKEDIKAWVLQESKGKSRGTRRPDLGDYKLPSKQQRPQQVGSAIIPQFIYRNLVEAVGKEAKISERKRTTPVSMNSG